MCVCVCVRVCVQLLDPILAYAPSLKSLRVYGIGADTHTHTNTHAHTHTNAHTCTHTVFSGPQQDKKRTQQVQDMRDSLMANTIS